MNETEETGEEARQGETSRRHRIFKLLVVSIALAILFLFVILLVFVGSR